MSMKIERSSLDQVRARFEANKKKQDEKKKEYDIEERLKEIREEVIRFCNYNNTVHAAYKKLEGT
jgi:U4/U6.U5 tri-snRNP component SNU23